jgi:glycerophosphoryl diester phosphodiesterase
LRPENTLPAFAYALGLGVDVLELDLNVTSDEQLLVTHDARVNPTICEGDGVDRLPLVRELTLAAAQVFDCGSLRNPRFPRQEPIPGTRMPTLNEVFEWISVSPDPQASQVGFNIEMKSDSDHPELGSDPALFAGLVAEALRRHGMLERVVVQSFDSEMLVELRKLEPGTKISFLSDNWRHDLARIARELRADIVSPSWTLLNRRKVHELHAQGTRVVPWTANTERSWDLLIDLEVDGIISDDPAGLIEHLRSHGLR